MHAEKPNPEQDPSEGSRATIERELKRVPDAGENSGPGRKPDTPADGPRGREKNS